MTGTLATVLLAASVASTGGLFGHRDRHPPEHGHHHHHGGVVPPGPGDGWGFPNGSPDGYGYVDYGWALPLGADRTDEYFFPRHWASIPEQMFFPNYYNPYLTRGQRYIPYTACGGAHPNGGPPTGSSATPVFPFSETARSAPVVPPPSYNGHSEAPPITSGGSGLIP